MQRFFAFILLIILSPFIALIIIVLFIASGNPIIFRQERIGLNKEPFIVFKFRTMTNGQIHFIGRILRKTGLDEIPQFINIVRGEMNFVGPRPLTQSDISRLNWTKEEHSFRWSVLPGITGVAQLDNVCNADISLSNDRVYIENKSIHYDIKLIIKSLLIPFVGKGKKTISTK